MIDDGTGTGNKVEVNSLHQLSVRSIGTTYHQFVSCVHEQAYMASLGTEAKPTLTVTGTGGYMMYLKNTSTDYDAIIARITIATSALALITLMKNPTIGSLGNETATTPVNKNFKSGKVADVDVYTWDEVGDGITGITSGDCVGTYQVNGFERLLFDESMCLGLNDIIAIKAKNAVELAIVMHGYYIVPA
jgi:hypothetical protein